MRHTNIADFQRDIIHLGGVFIDTFTYPTVDPSTHKYRSQFNGKVIEVGTICDTRGRGLVKVVSLYTNARRSNEVGMGYISLTDKDYKLRKSPGRAIYETSAYYLIPITVAEFAWGMDSKIKELTDDRNLVVAKVF